MILYKPDSSGRVWTPRDASERLAWAVQEHTIGGTHLNRVIRWIIPTLFFLNAALWIVIGTITMIRRGTTVAAFPGAIWALILLIAGNVITLVICGLLLNSQRRLVYALALAVLAMNVILSVTDEIGLFDVLTLVLNLGTLGLLISFRRAFVKSTVHHGGLGSHS